MKDNSKSSFPQDATRVNTDLPWELEYWSRKFGVSKSELIEAVALIGVSVAALERYLGSNKPSSSEEQIAGKGGSAGQ